MTRVPRWWACLLILGCDDGAMPLPLDAGVTDMRARPVADAAPPLPDASPPDAAPDAARDALVDMSSPPACADGRDNDADGRVDFPADPGCSAATDDDEADPLPECADGQDNDADGLLDAADPDCVAPADTTESGDNPITLCANTIDDDADGLIDYPFDPGCLAAGHVTEADPVPPPACANAVDDDADGVADFPADPGCAAASDVDEADPDPLPACGNGMDDDANGATDWPADFGCFAAGDPSEVSPCGPARALIDLDAHLAENAAFEGDLTGREDHLLGRCGGAAGGEYAFIYTVDSTLDRLVFSTDDPATQAPVVMYVRETCQGADLACARGVPAAPGAVIELDAPAPGRYVLVIDTGSRDAVGPFRLTVRAIPPPACRDAVDNDGDGRVDRADPGCLHAEDDDEADPPEPPACANGVDDDDDGVTDWPDDPDCATAGGPREAPPCALPIPFAILDQAGGAVEFAPVPGPGAVDPVCEVAFGAENLVVLTLTEPSDVEFRLLDLVGDPVQSTLHARTDCADPTTEIACRPAVNANEPVVLPLLDRGTYFLFAEQGLVAPNLPVTAEVVVTSRLGPCNDRLDNDDDGAIDDADPGCADPQDMDERDPPAPPACADGLDNDANGLIDWPADPGCERAGDLEEAPGCAGEVFDGICVERVSGQCVQGSARAYCQALDPAFEVITMAEFQAIVAAGWQRPTDQHHTVAVTEYDRCPGGVGNVGIPGWGAFERVNCEEVSNYCNRAVICVRR